ncbi:hypothetical protein DFJ74DRAFT_46075 [Hyaloraphidium curvatum]|nr:hypothetical protein DFJ74DRAFT_46075 [Hyaloraphidium curvatum]
MPLEGGDVAWSRSRTTTCPPLAGVVQTVGAVSIGRSRLHIRHLALPPCRLPRSRSRAAPSPRRRPGRVVEGDGQSPSAEADPTSDTWVCWSRVVLPRVDGCGALHGKAGVRMRPAGRLVLEVDVDAWSRPCPPCRTDLVRLDLPMSPGQHTTPFRIAPPGGAGKGCRSWGRSRRGPPGRPLTHACACLAKRPRSSRVRSSLRPRRIAPRGGAGNERRDWGRSRRGPPDHPPTRTWSCRGADAVEADLELHCTARKGENLRCGKQAALCLNLRSLPKRPRSSRARSNCAPRCLPVEREEGRAGVRAGAVRGRRGPPRTALLPGLARPAERPRSSRVRDSARPRPARRLAAERQRASRLGPSRRPPLGPLPTRTRALSDRLQ